MKGLTSKKDIILFSFFLKIELISSIFFSVVYRIYQSNLTDVTVEYSPARYNSSFRVLYTDSQEPPFVVSVKFDGFTT